MKKQVEQEYWLFGQAFIYDADLQKKVSKLIIQNPDYMIVERKSNENNK
jgi:hypothetical protein